MCTDVGRGGEGFSDGVARKKRVQEGWSVGINPREVKSLGIEKVLIFTQGIPNGLRI